MELSGLRPATLSGAPSTGLPPKATGVHEVLKLARDPAAAAVMNLLGIGASLG